MKDFIARLFGRAAPSPAAPAAASRSAIKAAVPVARPTAPRDLTEAELRFIHDERLCPFCCSSKGLQAGPRGGASLNLFCRNADCDTRLNVVDPIFGFVPIGQFIGSCPPELIEEFRGIKRPGSAGMTN